MDKLTQPELDFINSTFNVVQQDINLVAEIQEDNTIKVNSPLDSSFNADIILKYYRASGNASLPQEKFINAAAQEIKQMMELGY